MAKLYQHSLSTGWTFKESNDPDGPWMPVPVIPSVMHQDLMANKKYVRHVHTVMVSAESSD